MSNDQPVQASIVGKVGIVELARPEKFNSLSGPTAEGLLAALHQFELPESGVRAILLRAQGKNFCTGADLNALESIRADRTRFAAFIKQGHDMLKAYEQSPLPVVAATHGMCLAGGLELMLACDVVFAATDARFGDQHAQYGLVPGWGGSQRLTRVIGLRRAMDMYFSARWVDAATALHWGLVNYVCEPDALQQTALDYCNTLAQRSQEGLAAMKKLARRGLDMSLDAGLHYEEEVVANVLPSDDATEGIAAFRERRVPTFKSCPPLGGINK